MLWAAALLTSVLAPLTDVQALDAACQDAEAKIVLDLEPLSDAEQPIQAREAQGTAPEIESEPVRRPYRALSGAVLVHLVGVEGWRWDGQGPVAVAVEKWRLGTAKARVIGSWSDADDLPPCFGHAQIDARAVALAPQAVSLRAEGQLLGRFIPTEDDDATIEAGGPVEIHAECGTPCVHSAQAIDAALSKVRPALTACFNGAPAGRMAFEIAFAARRKTPSLRGEVSTYEEKLRACARDATAQLRLPSRAADTAVVVTLETPVKK